MSKSATDFICWNAAYANKIIVCKHHVTNSTYSLRVKLYAWRTHGNQIQENDLFFQNVFCSENYCLELFSNRITEYSLEQMFNTKMCSAYARRTEPDSCIGHGIEYSYVIVRH